MARGLAVYTDLIVGAGSAGCVLANRLSTDRSREVLVVEAGEFYRSADTPPEVSSPNNTTVSFDARFMWPLEAQLNVAQPRVPFQQGMGVGGSSSVNNTWAPRARRGDLDRWHASGCSAIGWDELLRHYCAIENDLDFGAAEFHGDRGPQVVSRSQPARWTPVDHAFRKACVDWGLGETADLNDPCATGISPLAMTLRNERRVSAHDAFLDPVVDRPNLTVTAGAMVQRLTFDRARVTGVIMTVDGAEEHVAADNVILAAGAVQSPTILLRSGIGPADGMAAAGISPHHRLDWVGRNLAEHPMFVAAFPLVEPAQTTDTEARQANLLARPDGGPNGDPWHLSCLSFSPFAPTMASLFVALMHSTSRGSVVLEADGTSHLSVDGLAEQADVDRLWEGVEQLVDIAYTRPLQAVAAGPLMTAHGPLDLDAGRAEPAAFLRQVMLPYRHLAGTCRIADRAEDGVVDSRHRVHGLDNLYVADASVLPDATSSNLNLTVIALANRAADLI
jgi:choline dehydrogenase-like flavoprotein